MNYINFNAKNVDNPTSKATINELVIITCLWCTNMFMICSLNERFAAPFGGFISSSVAKGDNRYDSATFKITPIKAEYIEYLTFLIYNIKI